MNTKPFPFPLSVLTMSDDDKLEHPFFAAYIPYLFQYHLEHGYTSPKIRTAIVLRDQLGLSLYIINELIKKYIA